MSSSTTNGRNTVESASTEPSCCHPLCDNGVASAGLDEDFVPSLSLWMNSRTLPSQGHPWERLTAARATAVTCLSLNPSPGVKRHGEHACGCRPGCWNHGVAHPHIHSGQPSYLQAIWVLLFAQTSTPRGAPRETCVELLSCFLSSHCPLSFDMQPELDASVGLSGRLRLQGPSLKALGLGLWCKAPALSSAGAVGMSACLGPSVPLLAGSRRAS